MEALLKDVQYLKGVGPRRSAQLRRLGIETVFDLLWHVPRAYFNRGNLHEIGKLNDGENVNIRGTVLGTEARRSRRGMTLFKALVQDETGMITAVWFNQPHLDGKISSGQEIFISGKVKASYGSFDIQVTEYELLEGEDLDFKVLPLYPLTEGINQKYIRKLVLAVLEEHLHSYPEIFTSETREQYGLCPIHTAFRSIHFPEDGPSYLQARKRLAFEELYLFQISLRQDKDRTSDPGRPTVHRAKGSLASQVERDLPFELTLAQRQALREIFNDMEADRPMNRLLQGDVGSGKTVVAAMAMAKAVSSGYQAAIMAPTEILAEQHLQAMRHFFHSTEVTIASLTGATTAAERRSIMDGMKNGGVDILVGTHALIADGVEFKSLGLVIIDEQHRFGVRQRALLGAKGKTPDILVMSATPIPRTLALTAYGDLSLSVIDHLPPGRKPVKTVHIKTNERMRAYRFIQQEAEKDTQAYVVCPLVEESEKQDLQAATSLYEELRREILPDLTVGLVHGRMKPAEKDYIMGQFKAGAIKVLVSTTVIEVGVDVPNASIMVIEHAERFGLSQLHQLRGRVGRGSLQSYCLLIADPRTDEAIARIRAMERSNDGFQLALEDMRLRGPGDFWGVRQHGLHLLKVADLLKDQRIIEMAHHLADSQSRSEWEGLALYIDQKFKKSAQIANN
ncbi:MAG: ATP-dependent DNA helicase RecG [Deltaproteobacteria bacterium]